MASKCGNCGNRLGCGCQKRTTADGRTGCVKCINKLQQEKPKEKE
jgi:hypothetical protein